MSREASRQRFDKRVSERSDRLCECGCGQRTMISPYTKMSKGWVKGQPRRFVKGHQVGMALAAAHAARRAAPRKFRLKVVKRRAKRPWPRCECGCGELTMSRVARFAAGHLPVRGPRKQVRYVVDAETGCWTWALTVVRGYGKVTRGGRKMSAHRVAYEDAYGSIPEGHDVHHRCENKRCVNPEHLQALTPEEHGRLHEYGVAV